MSARVRTAGLLAPRWKRYASWPAVIWCRLKGHRIPIGKVAAFIAGPHERCYDCGDVLADRLPHGGVNKATCKHVWIADAKGKWCRICGTGM